MKLISFLFLLMVANSLFAQNGYFSLNGGLSHATNYNTNSNLSSRGAGSLRLGGVFEAASKFKPSAEMSYNIYGFKQDLFEGAANKITVGSIDLLGGVQTQVFSDQFNLSALVGPSITSSANSSSSDSGYLENDVYNEMTLKGQLSLFYSVSKIIEIGLCEKINITGLQKPYRRVDDMGNAFEEPRGLNILQSQLSLKLNFE